MKKNARKCNWLTRCCVVFLKRPLSHKNILFLSKFKERVFEYEVFTLGIIHVLKAMKEDSCRRRLFYRHFFLLFLYEKSLYRCFYSPRARLVSSLALRKTEAPYFELIKMAATRRENSWMTEHNFNNNYGSTLSWSSKGYHWCPVQWFGSKWKRESFRVASRTSALGKGKFR